MRKYPSSFDKFYKIAKKLKFPHPRGRALYAVNRLQNGWPRARMKDFPIPNEYWFLGRRAPEDFLKSVRDETAIRWENHWDSGGSIRVISRTSEEQNKFVRRQKHIR